MRNVDHRAEDWLVQEIGWRQGRAEWIINKGVQVFKGKLSFYSQLQLESKNLCVRVYFCEDRKEECLSVCIFF
jgi:hypothetical protein